MRLKRFLQKVNEVILIHIEDEDFNVGKLAEYLNLSRSQTLRKIKKATGFSTNEYIREFRLNKAIELLKDGTLTIAEVSYRVGFHNPSYFNKCFHERFQYSPGEYRDEVLFRECSTAKLKIFRIAIIIVCIIAVILALVWYHRKII